MHTKKKKQNLEQFIYRRNYGICQVVNDSGEFINLYKYKYLLVLIFYQQFVFSIFLNAWFLFLAYSAAVINHFIRFGFSQYLTLWWEICLFYLLSATCLDNVLLAYFLLVKLKLWLLRLFFNYVQCLSSLMFTFSFFDSSLLYIIFFIKYFKIVCLWLFWYCSCNNNSFLNCFC